MKKSPSGESRRYLSVAVGAAQAGGKLLLANLGKLSSSQVQKKGLYDWVTAMDHRSEEAIIRIIQRAFPRHAIQAEESSPMASRGAFVWLIDPLDGTVNYIHRFPMFGVSIALVYEGRLQVGVVYDPQKKECFTALRGEGARLNGRRIQVSRHPRLEEAMLATGFPFRAKRQLDLYLESFRRVFLRTGSIRRAGSAAIDLAYAACGRVDGFWEMALAPWDMAAGALLIEEAGGKVSDFFGEGNYLERGHIAAGSPAVHRALVKLLAPLFRGRID